MRTRSIAMFTILPCILVPVTALGASPEKFPAETLLYVSWPGRTALGETFGDTALSRIMSEPQMQPLREQFIPALDALVRHQIPDEQDLETYARCKELLEALCEYPTALAGISVDASSIIPLVNAGLIVEAGERSGELATKLEFILQNTGLPTETINTVKIGSWEMRELAIMGPGMSLRWGVIDNALVVAFGNKLLKHLVPGYLAPATNEATPNPEPAQDQPPARSLAANPLFAKALEVTGGSPASPVVFVNLDEAIRTLESFQPMLASFGVPVLGEEGGLRKGLAEFSAENAKSFTMTWTSKNGGLQSTMFLHAPGMKPEYPPLSEADFKTIPETASWASAGQTNLERMYDALLGIFEAISAEKHSELMEVIAEVEQRMGMQIGEDVLGSFGDTWIVYDDPENGSLLFTGITVVADVKPGQRIDEALRGLVRIIAEESGTEDQITLREEDYRGQKITYMNFSSIPMPFAPAWAVYEDRWIAAMYPQMVRVALDRFLNPQSKSILDNEGFNRGWKLVPPDATSMNYVDAALSIRRLYALALPFSQILIAMGQEEGFDMDIAALPSLTAITQHVFPTVTGGATTDEGYLARSYGAIPATLASAGHVSLAGPIIASVALRALPSLHVDRLPAKRTVSMANLRQIGTGCLIYAQEHQDKLPPDLQTLVDSGVISEKTLISPLDPDPGEEGSYRYVGAGLTTRMDPGMLVAYEKPEIHGGHATNALFLDGHVEFTTMDRVDSLLEQNRELAPELDEEGREKEEDEADDEMRKLLEEEEREERGELRSPRSSVRDSAEARLTKSLISPAGPIGTAIDTFRLEMGRYPKQLSELSQKPADEDEAARWNGPYVKDASDIADAWGQPLKYLSPGEANETSYDLWSVGPDGRSGTEDDITNW